MSLRTKIKRVIFEITPQSHVRSTQNDSIYFKIPYDKLYESGKKRKDRLERYNKYKLALSTIANSKKFTPPEQGGHLFFYIPVPKSWKDHKKRTMHLALHQTVPDWDNLAKAFFDALLHQDKMIADIRVTKKWVNQETGWIEFAWEIPQMRSRDTLV